MIFKQVEIKRLFQKDFNNTLTKQGLVIERMFNANNGNEIDFCTINNNGYLVGYDDKKVFVNDDFKLNLWLNKVN